MDGFEIIAAIVLFAVGYWVVSAVWPKRGSQADPQSDSDPNDKPKL